jgi:UDP-N-acetylmuramoyl-L-alanyl-D-glutamate--2,6-diaminopimelate ligase
VHYDVAVFTNLTRDHLDYHGDMASYGAAKAKLFKRPGLRAAVVNIDDAFGRELLAALPSGVRGIGASSQGAQADVRAENLALGDEGLAFDLVLGDARRSVRSPLLGRFNADNLVAVAGVLHALGIDADAIAGVLPRLEPIAGRMNRLGGGEAPLVVVDYSHKPDALEQALESLRGHLRGKLVCVFGCGGERDRGKRPQMAAIAEAAAGLVIVTDDNPRGEDGDAIVADIMAGFADPSKVVVERDRRRAIERAVGAAQPGDIVLVAGKGHETYQEVAGVKHPFDDREVAAAALAAHRPEPRA